MVRFRACSSDEIDQLNEDLKEAEMICNEAILLLSCTPVDNRPTFVRYKTWFGDYSEERYAKVTDNFKKIRDAIANKDIIFFCHYRADIKDINSPTYFDPSTCEGLAAFVIATQPYKIYLCGGFWGIAINSPGKTRAGVILHEISHFKVVSGTEDIVGDQGPCMKLAVESPSGAISNADSYHLFAVNNPSLSVNNSLVDFASTRCVDKPFSVRAALMPKLGLPKDWPTSLRRIMREPIYSQYSPSFRPE
jgi:peptidyl-Lys metalloendopeptidase